MALVGITRDAAVATIVLDRPDARNALSIDMCNAIVDALDTVDGSDARVAVVRGEGKVFCSGADFAAVSGEGALEFLPAFERMLEAVARFRLPTVAAIHGAALGGGFQLATVCDFRIATDDARLGIPSSRLGILVNFENIQRLVLLAGIATAKEILMGGRELTGEAAVRRGLVTRSVAPEAFDAEVAGFASELATLAPLSVQGVKRAVQVVADHLSGARRSDPDAARAIDELVTQAYRSDDLAEGLKAMGEKRPPEFRGH